MVLGIKKKEKTEAPAKKEEPKKTAPKKEAATKDAPKKAAPKKEPVKKAAAKDEDSKPKSGAYFVSPHPDGGWQVKKANASKALKLFDTKAEAEKYAKTVAKNQDSNVVRQKKDGKIQKKH